MIRSPLALRDMFEPPAAELRRHEIRSDIFSRSCCEDSGQASFTLDQFSDAGGASCCFLRLSAGEARTACLVVEGTYGLESCPSGGWLLKPVQPRYPTYWIPRFPILRKFDAHGRILAEEPAELLGFKPAPEVTPRDLVRIRQYLKLSRALFAVYLRTNVRTLENWEQGRAKPNAQAALLINLVKRFPDTVERLAAI